MREKLLALEVAEIIANAQATADTQKHPLVQVAVQRKGGLISPGALAVVDDRRLTTFGQECRTAEYSVARDGRCKHGRMPFPMDQVRARNMGEGVPFVLVDVVQVIADFDGRWHSSGPQEWRCRDLDAPNGVSAMSSAGRVFSAQMRRRQQRLSSMSVLLKPVGISV